MMSQLHRKLQGAGLPPMMPPSLGTRVPRHKKRDYSVLPWNNYFDSREMVVTSRGSFCTYKKGCTGPVVVCLHGGGFSALSWALFSKHLVEAAQCQVLAFDLRGHGDTKTSNDSDLSIETLSLDVGAVIQGFYINTEPPPVVLLGHSMGGSVAVHSSKIDIVPSQIGLVVIDVVEGSAMESLNGMKSFLRSRPQMFKSLEHAIEWSVRGGQIKNCESARVSMIGQLKPCVSAKALPSADYHDSTDVIKEEEEGESAGNNTDHQSSSQTVSQQTDVPHEWRIDLEKTEEFWSGWFKGLSSLFLSTPVPKVLILAGVDRLDKDLAIGQMQGKFQMQIVGQAGHAVHEDAPDKVADVVATYMIRNKFTVEGEYFHRVTPTC